MEFSGNPLSFLKEVKSIVVFDVEHGVALKPMKETPVSFRVDLGYTKLFYVPVLTSVSFYYCDSFLGDSLEFHQANKGSLHV